MTDKPHSSAQSRSPRQSAESARKIRMTEVAELAGVSIATVSRALRDPDSVSAPLRQKVQDTCARLGYSPSPIAGSLAGSRSPLVGVVVPSLSNSFFAGTLKSMCTVLEPAGYQLMIGDHEYNLEREERLVTAFSSWNPSALVVTGVDHTRTTTNRLCTVTCPVVEMWDLDGRPLDTLIGFSNHSAGEMAARHFIDAGFRNIAYVGAILDRDTRARARSRGFVEYTSRHPDSHAEIISVDKRETGCGCSGLRQALERTPQIEAIAFSGDMLATGALFEAARLGIRIPDELAIMGYGDLDIAPHTNPALSTIRPPRDEIGTRVAEHILSRLDDANLGGDTVNLGVELVLRQSC